MTRVLAVVVAAAVLSASHAVPSLATINDDPQYWKVLTSSLCQDEHEHVVVQKTTPGPYFAYDKIRATWNPITKEALEKAEGGKSYFQWVKRTCNADPWMNSKAKAACTYVDGWNKAAEDNLLPYDITHPVPPEPSQVPVPTIKSPQSGYNFPAGDPVVVNVEADVQGSFCGKLAVTMTAPKGKFSLPLSIPTPTTVLVTTWKPQGWAGGPVPEGTWTMSARLEVYDGKGGSIKGKEATRTFYVGTKPANLSDKIDVVYPGSASPLSAPAYDIVDFKTRSVEVRIHKDLYDVMSKRVALSWKAPWAVKAGLPSEIVIKQMFSPSSELRTVKSAPLDFTGQPAGKWELKACVLTEWGQEVCSPASYFTVNPPAAAGGGGGGGGGGVPSGSQAASSPSSGAASSAPAAFGGVRTPPDPGVRTPPTPQTSTRLPVGAPQLRSASAQGTTQAVLAWAAPAGAMTAESAVEIRLGTVVVGKGTLKALGAGEQASLTVALTLPRGTSLPADLAVFAGATRAGSLRVGASRRGR